MSRETRLEGKTFDQRYRIDEFVGSGGMSEVYRAHDLQIGIAVALKVLKPSLSADEQQRERFINEARRTAVLRHAHIVLIYGFGEDQGFYYIAMDFLEGEPLDDYLRRRGPLPLDEAVKIVKAVASALDAAHRKGLIHRDVKAANVMRSPHGDITLTDFGLVRELAKTRFTRTGTVMGTPQYMSPEQIKTPLDIDHRTDVYALGHLAYELLTGAPAIDENLSEYDIYEKQIKHTFPAPSSVVTGLGPAIDEVVAGALAKDRDERHESAGKFAAALAHAAEVIEREDGHEVEPGSDRMLLGFLALALMLLIAWFIFHSADKARSRVTAVVATAEAAMTLVTTVKSPVTPTDITMPVAAGPSLMSVAAKVEYKYGETEAATEIAAGESVPVTSGANILVAENGHGTLTWPDFLTNDLYSGADLLVSLSVPEHRQAVLDQAAGTARYQVAGVRPGGAAAEVKVVANWIEVKVDKGKADFVVSYVPGALSAVWVVCLEGTTTVVFKGESVTINSGEADGFAPSGVFRMHDVDGRPVKAWLDTLGGGTDKTSIDIVLLRDVDD